MKILVTGHKGYIGSVLVPILVAKGYEVTGLDSGLFEACVFPSVQSTSADKMAPQISWQDLFMDRCFNVVKDIRDITARDLKGFDTVIHLAGLSNDPLCRVKKRATYEINHLATIKLAVLAKTAGVRRFLYASTASGYDATGDQFVDEETGFRPVSAYEHSKIMGEKGLRALADASFSPVYLRNGTAYGLSARIRFDLVLNNFMAWCCCENMVYLKSDGSAWRPMVHVEDIALAFCAVLKAPLDTIHNQALNVGVTEENYQISELAQMIQSIIPDIQIKYADDAFQDTKSYRVNCDKIRRLLPLFEPRWTVHGGIEQLYRALKSGKVSQEDFEGTTFCRTKRIENLLSNNRIDETFRWRRESDTSQIMSALR